MQPTLTLNPTRPCHLPASAPRSLNDTPTQPPSAELIDAAEAWKSTVHAARFDTPQRSGRARIAPTGRSLHDQQPLRIAGTHPLPLNVPLTTPNWQASVAIWSTILPDADELDVLALDDATVVRLLSAYGLPSDTEALQSSLVDHISARSWLYAGVGDAAEIAALPAATHAFVQEHAPGLWLRLAPARDCLELMHGLFWLELGQMEYEPLPIENERFQRLLRLLPAQVRTLSDTRSWLSERSVLALWISLRVDDALLYTPSKDRESLRSTAELLRIGHERFTDEVESCRDAWFLQRWVLRARTGELAEAEQIFKGWIEAHPKSCVGKIAFADALAGNTMLDPVNPRAQKRALGLLERLEYRTDDADEKWSIRTLRAQIEAALRCHRRALKRR